MALAYRRAYYSDIHTILFLCDPDGIRLSRARMWPATITLPQPVASSENVTHSFYVWNTVLVSQGTVDCPGAKCKSSTVMSGGGEGVQLWPGLEPGSA